MLKNTRSIAIQAISLVLLLSLALVATVPATAGTLDKVKERGVLVAGVKAQFPPFGYMSSSGEHVGFDVAVAHQFAKALFGDPGKVKFVSVTSGNRVPYLQSKKIDIIMASMTVTPARSEVVDFSLPYFLAGSLLLVPNDSKITGLDDLAGKTVGVIQGAVQGPDIKELAPKANLVEYGKVSQGILALKTGRIDAFSQDDITVLTLAKKIPDLKAVGKSFKQRPYGFAVRKGDTEFINWVNSQLKKMKEDGAFAKIWDQYFGDVDSKLVKPDLLKE